MYCIWILSIVKINKDELLVDSKKLTSNTINLVNDKVDYEVTLYVKK